MRKVAGALDRLEARTRNGRAIRMPIILVEDVVVGAPQEQRRNSDAMQARLELGIVHVRRPAQSRGGFPIARHGERFGVVQVFGVVPAPARIEISKRVELIRRERQVAGMSGVSGSAALVPIGFGLPQWGGRPGDFTPISAAVPGPGPTA